MNITTDTPADGLPQVPPAQPAAPRRGLRARIRDFRDNLAHPDPTASLLLNGKHIRFRFVQMSAWLIGAALAGSFFMSGLYYGFVEQHWYIHIASFNHGSSLKTWWDNGMGFIHSTNWYLYRHGVRDIGGPAVATMAGKTLLAKRKIRKAKDGTVTDTWSERVGTVRLLVTPAIVLILAIVLPLGGIWLLDFGGPNAWHHLFGSRVVDTSALGTISAGQLVLGYVIGQVIHRIWAPVGGTLQGDAIDRAVAKSKSNAQASGRKAIPAWVRKPLMPPIVRERFCKVWRTTAHVATSAGTHRLVIRGLIFFIAVVSVYGAVAHYVVGHGIHVPYMNP